MHEVLVNRLGGLSLPRKSVARLTDRPDMTLDVYRGRKTITQQQQLAAGSIASVVNNQFTSNSKVKRKAMINTRGVYLVMQLGVSLETFESSILH